MKLAKATLGELPKQLVEFFQNNKINPMPPLASEQEAMRANVDKSLD